MISGLPQNCWEFMDCDEPRRESCPAYPDLGSECWTIAGTHCKTGAKGQFAQDLRSCSKCGWYQYLRLEKELERVEKSFKALT